MPLEWRRKLPSYRNGAVNLSVIGLGHAGKDFIEKLKTALTSENNPIMNKENIGKIFLSNRTYSVSSKCRDELDQAGLNASCIKYEELNSIKDETDIALIFFQDPAGWDNFKILLKKDLSSARDSISESNIPLVKDLAEKFNKFKGTTIFYTNNTDVMPYLFAKLADIEDYNKCVGMNFVDTQRFRLEIKKKFKSLTNNTLQEIQKAFIYGLHDEKYMVPAYPRELIDNFKGILTPDTIIDIEQKTISKVPERIALAGGNIHATTSDSTSSTLDILKAILNEKDLVVVSNYVNYIKDRIAIPLFMGWPVRFKGLKSNPLTLDEIVKSYSFDQDQLDNAFLHHLNHMNKLNETFDLEPLYSNKGISYTHRKRMNFKIGLINTDSVDEIDPESDKQTKIFSRPENDIRCGIKYNHRDTDCILLGCKEGILVLYKIDNTVKTKKIKMPLQGKDKIRQICASDDLVYCIDQSNAYRIKIYEGFNKVEITKFATNIYPEKIGIVNSENDHYILIKHGKTYLSTFDSSLKETDLGLPLDIIDFSLKKNKVCLVKDRFNLDLFHIKDNKANLYKTVNEKSDISKVIFDIESDFVFIRCFEHRTGAPGYESSIQKMDGKIVDMARVDEKFLISGIREDDSSTIKIQDFKRKSDIKSYNTDKNLRGMYISRS